MVRAPYVDVNGVKKGAWSEEEDKMLTAYIGRYGHPNWRQLPKYAGLSRCGKSCRLRWMNYLRPNLKRGSYTQKEEQTIIDLHKKHGNKWSLIAEKLPGRTDNEIKNYWHSNLKKLLRSNEATSSDDDGILKSKVGECTESATPTRVAVSADDSDSQHNLESSMTMSSQISSYTLMESNVNLTREEDSVPSWGTLYGLNSSFWTEPFITENAFNQNYFPHNSCYEGEDPFVIW